MLDAVRDSQRDRPDAGLPLTKHDAHPFQGPPDGDEPCRLCGESRSQIRHHPTRIRAACALRGLDPDALG